MKVTKYLKTLMKYFIIKKENIVYIYIAMFIHIYLDMKRYIHFVYNINTLLDTYIYVRMYVDSYIHHQFDKNKKKKLSAKKTLLSFFITLLFDVYGIMNNVIINLPYYLFYIIFH